MNNLLFTYRCEDYIIVTEADQEEFQYTLKEVKETTENWDVIDVTHALRSAGYVSDVHLIHLSF